MCLYGTATIRFDAFVSTSDEEKYFWWRSLVLVEVPTILFLFISSGNNTASNRLVINGIQYGVKTVTKTMLPLQCQQQLTSKIFLFLQIYIFYYYFTPFTVKPFLHSPPMIFCFIFSICFSSNNPLHVPYNISKKTSFYSNFFAYFFFVNCSSYIWYLILPT